VGERLKETVVDEFGDSTDELQRAVEGLALEPAEGGATSERM
jgi:hypothetical protein